MRAGISTTFSSLLTCRNRRETGRTPRKPHIFLGALQASRQSSLLRSGTAAWSASAEAAWEKPRRLPLEILMLYCAAMEPNRLSEPELLRWYWMSLYMRLPEVGIAAILPSEDAARRRLLNVRWPNGIVCSSCESDRVGQKTTRDIYKCGSCGYQTSVTAGTALSSTNIPILLWLLAAEEYITRQATGRKNMLTNSSFMKFLGTRSNDTAVRVKRKLKADLEPGGVGMLLACICLTDDWKQLPKTPHRDNFDALAAEVLHLNFTRARR